MRNLCLTYCAFAIVAGTSQLLVAATITFGSPKPVSGPSDVFVGLGLVDSIMFSNINANASTVVNGVTFNRAVTTTGGPIPQNSVAGNIKTFEDAGQPATPTSTGDPNYDKLLSGESYTNPGSVYTITLSGLTIGSKYEVQAWADDFDKGTGANNLDLNFGQSNAVVVPSGNYILGTFTADATSQTLTWGSSSTGNFSIINALQVQLIPEPSSLVLGGLGAVGLLVAVRRRRGMICKAA